MKIRVRNQLLLLFLLALFLQPRAVAESAVAEPGAHPTPAAGHVSLVLGSAWLASPGEERQRLRVGMSIDAGDLVRTEPNGHVHIRFVDNALVSVRPDSRLEIVDYEFNRQHPALSRVKFNLEEGVARSISGDAATADRRRFRLNTPIAAIGVRGTDFVVTATRDSVRALVNEGAIVLAPYSEECMVDALGPCAANAVELSSASEQMLSFDMGASAPRLLPAVHETNPQALRDEVDSAIQRTAANEEEITSVSEAYLEGTADQRVTTLANSNASSPDEPVAPPPVVVDPGPGPGPESEPDFTPEQSFGEQQNSERQMVWGRWGGGKGELERITYAYEEASEGREVAIGNLEYALFRPDLPSRDVDAGLGVVEFDLAAAQAHYQSAGNTIIMQVNGGELAIDFDRDLFRTSLTLNHEATGVVLLDAEGRVYDGGYFRASGDGQRVSGAVTLDGSEAGYHFQKQLEDGNISGLTLWNGR